MMTLRGFSLVLSTVLLRHFASTNGQALHDADTNFSINLLVGTCVAVSVLAKLLAVTAALRYPTVSMQKAWREFESWRSILEWLWLPLVAWLLPASGFAQLLTHAEQNGWPHALSILAWFAPSILFLAALEFSATQLELDLAQQLRPRPSHLPTHLARWWARVRLGALGSLMMCLVPVVFVLGAIDALQWIVPQWSEVTRSICAVMMLAVSCLTLAPLWMKAWIGASSLDQSDELRLRLTSLCAQVNVSAPPILTVGGRHGWHGAALVGWVPPFRQLWIGQSLRSELTSQEIDMVLLHELAHLRRGHSWLRLLPVLLCGVWLVFMLSRAGGSIGSGDMSLLPVIVLCLAIAAVLSWVSHACELDADRDACIQASKCCTWAANQPGCAASVLSAALMKMNGADVSARRWNWLHPSIERRCRTLSARFSVTPQTLPPTAAS